MSDPIVLVEKDGPVTIVTLNRPDALNAGEKHGVLECFR